MVSRNATRFEKLSVFIPGHTLASGISHGAHGAYSNVACLNPAAAQRWYELCIRDIPAGLALEAKLRAFWDANVVPLITEKKLPNMAADKATAVAGSWLPGLTPRLRWPYACATTGTWHASAAHTENSIVFHRPPHDASLREHDGKQSKDPRSLLRGSLL